MKDEMKNTEKLNTNDECEEKDNSVEEYKCTEIIFTQSNVLIPCVSIIINLSDLISDIILAREYKIDGKKTFSLLTFVFLLAPSFIITALGERWRHDKPSLRQRCLSIIIYFLSMEQIIYHLHSLRYLIKTKIAMKTGNSQELVAVYSKLLKTNKNIAFLGRLDSCIKMATQFILQVILIFTMHDRFELHYTVLLQTFSIATCLISLGWHILCWLLERKIFIATFTLVVYVTDVFSDIILAVNYLLNGDILYSVLTISFVLLASTWITHRSYRRKISLPINTFNNFLICIPIFLFNLEPTIHSIKTISYALKTKSNNDSCKESMQIHRAIAAELKFYEVFIETAPQLMLQVTILFLKFDSYEVNAILIIQVISIITSFLGISVGIVASFNAWLFSDDRGKLPTGACNVMFMWYFPIIVFRILSISAAASLFPIFTLIGIAIHWSVAVIWWMINTNKQSLCNKILQAALLNLTYIFTPDPTDTTRETLWTSAILFTENMFATALWASTSWKSIKENFVLEVLICVNITGGIVGNIFMLIFLQLYGFYLQPP